MAAEVMYTIGVYNLPKTSFSYGADSSFCNTVEPLITDTAGEFKFCPL
jgi:hypothetical protein